MTNITRDLWSFYRECQREGHSKAWPAANGLFGGFVGLVMTMLMPLDLVPDHPNWSKVFTFVIYAAVAYAVFLLFMLLLVAPFLTWRKERNNRLSAEAHRTEAAQVDEKKRRLLDEFSELRVEMVKLRIDMEQNAGKMSAVQWQNTFDILAEKIRDKIEQFAGKAEANAYSHRGNISRTANTFSGGYVNPLHLDICIHDLDYLKKFIHDYSRGNRHV